MLVPWVERVPPLLAAGHQVTKAAALFSERPVRLNQLLDEALDGKSLAWTHPWVIKSRSRPTISASNPVGPDGVSLPDTAWPGRIMHCRRPSGQGAADEGLQVMDVPEQMSPTPASGQSA